MCLCTEKRFKSKCFLQSYLNAGCSDSQKNWCFLLWCPFFYGSSKIYLPKLSKFFQATIDSFSVLEPLVLPVDIGEIRWQKWMSWFRVNLWGGISHKEFGDIMKSISSCSSKLVSVVRERITLSQPIWRLVKCLNNWPVASTVRFWIWEYFLSWTLL